MSKNKIRKTVSFNFATESELIKHIEDKNFSGYVKELIEKDMNRKVVKKGSGLKIIVK